MNLGTFSISLTVKDIKASREFYEKLGFTKLDGDEEQNWLILECGTTKIGLFQGMFDTNIITFNPKDARAIEAKIKADGLTPIEATKDDEGSTHFTLVDPDGNPLLFDQHSPDTPQMPQEHGTIAWTDLTVPNADAVRDFYEAVIGWKPEPVSMGDYNDYNMTTPDGTPRVGVCHKRGMNKDIPSQWMIYIKVDNLEQSIAKCKELGGKIIKEQKGEDGNLMFAMIEDPAGAVCALWKS